MRTARRWTLRGLTWGMLAVVIILLGHVATLWLIFLLPVGLPALVLSSAAVLLMVKHLGLLGLVYGRFRRSRIHSQSSGTQD